LQGISPYLKFKPQVRTIQTKMKTKNKTDVKKDIIKLVIELFCNFNILN